MVSKEALRHNRLGEAEYKRRNYIKALEEFDKALEVEPNFDKAWYNKGLTQFNLKDLDAALKSYDTVVKLKPDNKSAWNNRGLILMELNKPQDAMKCFDKVTDLDSKDSEGWFNKGVLLANYGKYEDAIVCFDEVLRHNPEDKEALSKKAIALEATGHFDEAQKLFDQLDSAGAKGKKDTISRFDVDVFKMGDTDDKGRLIDDVEWLDRGSKLHTDGDIDRALFCYNKSIERCLSPKLKGG